MRLDKKDMVLYAVTDRHWLNGESLYSQVEKALKGGATFIQLREKNLAEEEFLAEAKEIARLCKSYHVPFVINDNVEIAKKVDADGVHVGQSDMEALDVRKTLGEDKKDGGAGAKGAGTWSRLSGSRCSLWHDIKDRCNKAGS